MAVKKGVTKKRVICEKCSDWIDLKEDHYVVLSTYNRISSPDHHAYFHFSCWCDYFRECVENRVLKVKDIMKSTTERLLRSPIFNEILDLVPSGKKIINVELLDDKKIIKQNGKRKKGKKQLKN